MKVLKNGKKQDIGLVLLGIGSSFGVWSALNTSPVGTVEFGASNPDVMWQGMGLGLATILGLAIGIGFIYGKRGETAAWATGLTGLGLFSWYSYLVLTAPTTV